YEPFGERALRRRQKSSICETCYLGRRLLRKWEHRADINLAKHMRIFASRSAWTVKKIGIPNNRQRPGVNIQQLHHLRRPLRLHLYPECLKWRCRGRMHDPRARLCGVRVGAFGWRRNQRPDELMPKTNDLFAAHITPDHALGQPQLERLIDNAAVTSEIDLATSHEVIERH